MRIAIAVVLISIALIVFPAYAQTTQKTGVRPSAQQQAKWWIIGNDAWKSGDYEVAKQYWKKCLDSGYVGANTAFGIMYQTGKGLDRDFEKALYHYKIDAAKGDADACFNIGTMYLNGDGVYKSVVEATKWFAKGAKLGSSAAQYNLGVSYQDGVGVPQNNILAYVWFSLSAVDGEEQYVKARNSAASRLTASQLSDAQSIAVKMDVKRY